LSDGDGDNDEQPRVGPPSEPSDNERAADTKPARSRQTDAIVTAINA
jgi:hypothetical protein